MLSERCLACSGESHAVVPAHEDRLRGVLGELEELSDGGADRRLSDPTGAVCEPHRCEHAAGFRLGADGAEPGRPVSRDQRQLGEGLDVLDQGWRPMDAALVDPWRGETGQGCAALDAAGQGRLLSGQEAERCRDQVDRDVIQACGGPVGKRGPQAPKQLRVAVDVEMDLPGADRLSGQLESVEDQMRGGPEQQLVLVACRFALSTVADDDGDAVLIGDGGELAVGGERRSAASGQARGLNRVDEHPGAATVGRLAVHLQVILELHRLTAGGKEPG